MKTSKFLGGLGMIAAAGAVVVGAGCNGNQIQQSHRDSAIDSSYVVEDSIREEIGINLHETGEFADGTRWGRIGALIYLLDVGGNPSSNGFHEIGRLENGQRYGVLGAMKYLLSETGGLTSEGFHDIIHTENGYYAILGACNFNLDDGGEIVSATPSDCRGGRYLYWK